MVFPLESPARVRYRFSFGKAQASPMRRSRNMRLQSADDPASWAVGGTWVNDAFQTVGAPGKPDDQSG